MMYTLFCFKNLICLSLQFLFSGYSYIHVLSFIGLFVCLLLTIAFFTLSERKIMAAIQRRKGPNVAGFWGLLQPIADGVKLILKEVIIPRHSNAIFFLLAPVIVFSISIISWVILPLTSKTVYASMDYSLLVFLGISPLGIYGIIIAGWASNSKYAFLGAIRSTAQMISYELALGFVLLGVVLCTGTFNLMTIIYLQTYSWLLWSLWPLAIIFLIVMLAETNRAPFDLPEAEAELVAGYNVEYSAMMFALFFLGEYSSMLVMCTLFTICFLGGWGVTVLGEIFFIFKILILAFFFVLMRSILPRTRYDQLMFLGWKTLVPLAFGILIFLLSFKYLVIDINA